MIQILTVHVSLDNYVISKQILQLSYLYDILSGYTNTPMNTTLRVPLTCNPETQYHTLHSFSVIYIYTNSIFYARTCVPFYKIYIKYVNLSSFYCTSLPTHSCSVSTTTTTINTPIYMSLCVCVEDDEYSLSSKSN